MFSVVPDPLLSFPTPCCHSRENGNPGILPAGSSSAWQGKDQWPFFPVPEPSFWTSGITACYLQSGSHSDKTFEKRYEGTKNHMSGEDRLIQRRTW